MTNDANNLNNERIDGFHGWANSSNNWLKLLDKNRGLYYDYKFFNKLVVDNEIVIIS